MDSDMMDVSIDREEAIQAMMEEGEGFYDWDEIRNMMDVDDAENGQFGGQGPIADHVEVVPHGRMASGRYPVVFRTLQSHHPGHGSHCVRGIRADDGLHLTAHTGFRTGQRCRDRPCPTVYRPPVTGHPYLDHRSAQVSADGGPMDAGSTEGIELAGGCSI